MALCVALNGMRERNRALNIRPSQPGENSDDDKATQPSQPLQDITSYIVNDADGSPAPSSPRALASQLALSHSDRALNLSSSSSLSLSDGITPPSTPATPTVKVKPPGKSELKRMLADDSAEKQRTAERRREEMDELVRNTNLVMLGLNSLIPAVLKHFETADRTEALP